MSMFEVPDTSAADDQPLALMDLEDPSIDTRGVFIKRQQRERDAKEAVEEAHTYRPTASSSHRPYRLSLSPEDTLTRKESTAVARLRSLVFFILVFTAVAVSTALFWTTRQGESSQFETQYDGAAAKVLESFAEIVHEMGSISGLGVASSAHSVDHKSDWPFVTLSNFQQRAGNARHLSGALMVSIAPVVGHDQFQEWDDFVSDPVNNYWIDEGHAFQEELGVNDFEYAPNIQRSTLNDSRKVDVMHYFDAEGNPHPENNTELAGQEQRFYLPTWQVSPILKTRHVNENILRSQGHYHNSTNGGHHKDVRDATAQQAAVAIEKEAAFVGGFATAPPGTVQDSNPTTAFFAALMSVAAKREVPYLGDPMANIYIPVYDLFDESKRKAVAVMTSTIHWRHYFEKILPSNIRGIVVILENSCDGAYTYEIHGDEAHVVGPGDRHNPDFDNWTRSGSFVQTTLTLDDGTLRGIPLHQEGCQYSIRVYPSQQFYDIYITSYPIIITCSVIAVFLFTMGMFFVYNRLVDQRQQIVLTKAIQSSVKLEESNKELEEANFTIKQASAKQLQHFACMSHEIRTPLNCIVGMSSLLKDSMPDPEKAESMGMIVTSGELLLRVVDDVLDYAKLESGTVEIEVEKSYLQETLNAVVGAIETKAKSCNISLETTYDVSIGEYFETDSRRLQQILYNLLGNAIKFSKNNGKVELNVELCRLSRESPNSQTLRFIVKDYGKGIEEKDFEKIFLPFTQASSETERLYGGTGLGLAITKKLVNALGGTVSVESMSGKWTKMLVDFPLQDDSAVADIRAISSKLCKSTVFLVGCSIDELAWLGRIFNAYDVNFEPCSDLEALERELPNQSAENVGVCLIHENVYNKEICRRIDRNKERRIVLLSFGPEMKVKAPNGHYRSFSRMLPSVFIKALGTLVKNAQTPTATVPGLARKPSVQSFKDLRILIAEDNLVNQKVLVRILTRMGINNVEVVENGKLAVEREATGRFDLIFMDVQMPVMDGLEACCIIVDRQKQDEMLHKAKVVFCTAHVLDSFKEKCSDAGGSGFLSKPFRLQDVKSCLEGIATQDQPMKQ